MAKFRIHTHQRLHEWVAEEKGYFTAEGLEYEFGEVDHYSQFVGVQVADSAPEIKSGAFESYEGEGRACEVSTACHWMINVAASAQHGRMWRHAYSVCPSAIMVPPESSVKTPRDLLGLEIGVGYHSGSHFSALQALEPFAKPSDIKLKFVGWTMRRLEMALERTVPAANVFGTQMYVLEQQGFRKIVDSTFMMGYLLGNDANLEDAEKYSERCAAPSAISTFSPNGTRPTTSRSSRRNSTSWSMRGCSAPASASCSSLTRARCMNGPTAGPSSSTCSKSNGPARSATSRPS